MRNKYIGVITVRLSSSRLPQKALLPLAGKRVIDHVIIRAKEGLDKGLSHIVVCTSTESEDDVFKQIAREHGVDCFRGSLSDKIDRWRGAAEQFGADYIITIDGDDLFCDPELIATAIAQVEKNSADIVTADTPEYACGAFTHAISIKAIRKICEMKDTTDTEMTKPYLIKSGLFKVELLKTDSIFKNPKVRLTLDYLEDYEFFKRVFKELKMESNIIPLRDILRFLNTRPDIVAINFSCQQDFTRNQKRLEKLELKK